MDLKTQIHNEGVKLRAGLLNSIAATCLAAGSVTPPWADRVRERPDPPALVALGDGKRYAVRRRLGAALPRAPNPERIAGMIETALLILASPCLFWLAGYLIEKMPLD